MNGQCQCQCQCPGQCTMLIVVSTLLVIKMKNILKMTAKSCVAWSRVQEDLLLSDHFPLQHLVRVAAKCGGRNASRKMGMRKWENRSATGCSSYSRELIIFLQSFVWWPSVVLFPFRCHKCEALQVRAKCAYAALARNKGRSVTKQRSKPDAASIIVQRGKFNKKNCTQ